MKKKVIVLSLGGSLIIPDQVDNKYLKEFKKTILKNTRKYKFIVACGGGSVARKYISALRKAGMNERFQSFSGIGATRMNARFMNYFFKIDPEKGIPRSKATLKNGAGSPPINNTCRPISKKATPRISLFINLSFAISGYAIGTIR